ncbi:MAG: glycosyltransferase [Phycisphaerales bacterium]
MRILHISTRLILGGSQENTVLSCEGQARLGHEVHLAFGPIHGPEGSLLERVQRFGRDEETERRRDGATGSGITTHVIPHLIREINPVADARARRELKRLIVTLKPDIVHTHSSKAGIIGRAAAWSVSQRLARTVEVHYEVETGESQTFHQDLGVVHTIHGPPFMPIEGGVLKRMKVRSLNLAYTLAERHAAKRCHTIVSVADAMTSRFLARGIGRPDQYVTVRSGMETEPYLNAAPGESRDEMRARLGLAPGDFVVGTVARLAQHKGHDDLLDTLAADLKANPHWKLLWVGDGWWRDRLVARACATGLNVAELHEQVSRWGGEQVTPMPGTAPSPPHLLTSSPAQLLLTGLVPPQRIPGLIRAMDVLAHPSYREGLPRTVPQALLTGVCPVAYDVDGTGEVCRDGETGRLVRPGDRAGLREAIRWLHDHPAERAAMAARGRAECRERFSASAMVDALELVYARALRAARGPDEPRSERE